MTTIYSFDIFDTLFTRKTATPHGVFLLMQRKLEHEAGALVKELPAVLLHAFATQRIAAEQASRLQVEETTLDEIYARIQAQHGLTDALCDALKAMEIELECSSVVGIPENLARLDALIERGERAILLSDMYLPESAIRQMLRRAGCQHWEKIPLYLSSTLGFQKRSGRLFKHVLREEGATATDLRHLGDHTKSDYSIPRGMGIRAELYTMSQLTPWENFARDEGDLNWQLRAGLSRCHRLTTDHENWHDILGYAVGGAALLPYVAWVLREALARGIQQLFFVARDGQILCNMAERMKESLGAAAIDCHYIYGSRQAWNLPSIRDIGPRESNWILTTFQGLTPAKLARRLDLDAEWLSTLLKEEVDRTIGPHTIFGKRQLQGVRRLLQTNPQLQQAIKGSAAPQRERLQTYLQQEGMFSGRRTALVDLGWAGNLQDSLFLALEPNQRPTPLTGFYYGLHKSTALTGPANEKLPFALTPTEGNSERYGITWMADFLELFAAADHGSTMSYRRTSSGRVVPVLDQQGEALLKWGISDLQKGILAFVDDAVATSAAFDATELFEYRKPLMSEMARHMHAGLPCKEIAECLGSFPFSPEQEGDNIKETAPRLSLGEALIFLIRNSSRRKAMSIWAPGSAVRSGSPVTWLLHPRARGLFDVLFLRDLRYLSVILPVPVLKLLKGKMPACIMRFLEYRVHGRLVASEEKHPS